jgi:hypothetical protein
LIQEEEVNAKDHELGADGREVAYAARDAIQLDRDYGADVMPTSSRHDPRPSRAIGIPTGGDVVRFEKDLMSFARSPSTHRCELELP